MSKEEIRKCTRKLNSKCKSKKDTTEGQSYSVIATKLPEGLKSKVYLVKFEETERVDPNYPLLCHNCFMEKITAELE